MFKIKTSVYLFLFLITSCDRSIIDSDSGKTRKDIKKIFIKGAESSSTSINFSNQSALPNISKLLVAPPPPPMGNGELMSFAVTEEVPIKDILIELGRLADVDIEVDPTITGGIILKVTNKPLEEVAKRISDLADLRYTYKNNILRFEKDKPYTITYNVDFLIDNEIWTTIESSLNDLIILIKSDVPETKEPKLIINKPAGIITLFGNYKTHQAVDRYIEHVKINYSAQVLIEAKVVEVALNDSYQAGVDWSFINEGKGGISFNQRNDFKADTNTGYGDMSIAGGLNSNITTAIFGGNLSAAINALSTFGLTKTLSSPRVHAINNQKAELKFIQKLIYFSIEKEEESTGSGSDTTTNTTYTSTKQEEDVGVVLTITPSINIEKNEITLNVTPELKSQIGTVADPTEAKNIVPIIQSKSVNTSLKVKSGNVLVIGGLMSDESITNDTGIPILSGIPILGWLFKSRNSNKKLTETVIFIKATIVKSNGAVSDYDREIYNFTNNKDKYMVD